MSERLSQLQLAAGILTCDDPETFNLLAGTTDPDEIL